MKKKKLRKTTKEGKETIERLRSLYVINDEELAIVGKQKLLERLYECQSLFESLTFESEERTFYNSKMTVLISRLESDLEGQQDSSSFHNE